MGQQVEANSRLHSGLSLAFGSRKTAVRNWCLARHPDTGLWLSGLQLAARQNHGTTLPAPGYETIRPSHGGSNVVS